MVRSDHESGEATEFGGGGELGGLQLSHAGLQPIHTALDDRQFTAKSMDQAFQCLGDLSRALQWKWRIGFKEQWN